MEKCTFRELSFYSYLNDVKGKPLIQSGGEILLLLFFQWKVNTIVKKILIPKCIIINSDINNT